MTIDGEQTLEALRQRLVTIAAAGAPQVAALARWALDQPQELAFHSVRGLAERSGVNANTVVRLATALGFKGYDQCRAGFQAALRGASTGYGRRAEQLRSDGSETLPMRLRAAAISNTETLFDGDGLARIAAATDLLLDARRIHCIGVRSCYSVAHYLTYTGRMAFDTFAPPVTEPGAILDSLADATAGDAVILASYSHYSSEVLQAHRLARTLGTSIVALTDSHASPIADGAAVTFALPMDGPQPLPSLGAYFLLVETLVASMVARADGASGRIARYEARRLEFGAYRDGLAER